MIAGPLLQCGDGDGIPEGVTTSIDDDTVSASAVVDAPPAEVFDFSAGPRTMR